MKGLLLIVAGGIIFYLVSKTKGLSKLEFYAREVHYKKGKLYFVADIVNPGNTPLTIDAIFGNINYEGGQIGRIQYTDKLFIPANNSSSFAFPIIGNPFGIGSLIADIILGKKMTFQVIGTVSSMGFVFPFQNDLGVLNMGE